MYPYTTMKRLQIMIDEDLDAILDRLAMQQGTSKAALIRQCVRDSFAAPPSDETDPILAMAGVDDFPPAPVDEVVYR